MIATPGAKKVPSRLLGTRDVTGRWGVRGGHYKESTVRSLNHTLIPRNQYFGGHTNVINFAPAIMRDGAGEDKVGLLKT